MSAIAQDCWQDQEDDPMVSVDGRIDFRVEDAYWQGVHRGQAYYRAECNYEEDYAAAYCVGYIGYAQYGGRLEEAEKSLCANWERIKGDSRLTADEAMQAIRAAWHHASDGRLDEPDTTSLQPASQRTQQPAYA